MTVYTCYQAVTHLICYPSVTTVQGVHTSYTVLSLLTSNKSLLRCVSRVTTVTTTQ